MADNTAFSLAKQRSIGSSGIVFRDRRDLQTPRSKTEQARSLYIHIPFCAHKCHYCDFYSIVDQQDWQHIFVDRLVRELRAQAPYADQNPLKTIFVGGGTPSLLAPPLWETLLSALDELFDLSEIRAGAGEFSVENNPESVTEELAQIYAQGGVNRVSMGAQSFNTTHLQSLDRIHNPDKVPEAIEIFQQAGIQRVSIDLIFAVPGQTIDQWDADLRTALALPIEHLSAYGLTYEPGTAMSARLSRGEFVQMPDETEAAMYRHTIDTIRAHGFDRYEVSNHAKPGAQCQHNMRYWTNQDWLAAGPSASGHFRGARWKNTPRLDDYLKLDDHGFAPICEYEPPDDRRELMDLLMTSIRLAQGVDAAFVLEQAKRLGAEDKLQAAAIMCQEQGWLVEANPPHWQLTDEGFLFADRVAREFIGAVMAD